MSDLKLGLFAWGIALAITAPLWPRWLRATRERDLIATGRADPTYLRD